MPISPVDISEWVLVEEEKTESFFNLKPADGERVEEVGPDAFTAECNEVAYRIYALHLKNDEYIERLSLAITQKDQSFLANPYFSFFTEQQQKVNVNLQPPKPAGSIK